VGGDEGGSGANPAVAADFAGGAFPTGTVSFAAGEATKTITVNVAGDSTVEPGENFTVALSNPSAGTTIGTATATGTILNDDSTTTGPLPTVFTSISTANGKATVSGTSGAGDKIWIYDGATWLGAATTGTDGTWSFTDYIDGTIIKPGKTFSFNKVVGPRTPERGFREGQMIIGSLLVPSIGGGVCQTATTLFNNAFELGLPIVEDACEALGVPYWADSALFAAAGIPTVVFGPKGEGAHAAVEWVDVASAGRCAGIYTAVAAEFCA
jgi:hypothetical protein